jgi:hypothetical protein
MSGRRGPSVTPGPGFSRREALTKTLNRSSGLSQCAARLLSSGRHAMQVAVTFRPTNVFFPMIQAAYRRMCASSGNLVDRLWHKEEMLDAPVTAYSRSSSTTWARRWQSSVGQSTSCAAETA